MQWDTDPDFSTSTGSTGSAAVQTSQKTSDSAKTLIYRIDELTKGTEYYVRVKTNGGGSYSSSGYGQVAGPAVAAIRMPAPQNFKVELDKNDSTGRTLIASWDAVSGGTSAVNGYSLERDQVESFDSKLLSVVYPRQSPYLISALSYGAEYHFRLRTRARAGFVQSVPQIASWHTQLAVPTNLAMLTALSSTPQLRLGWTAVPSASSYTVQWDTNASFNNFQSAELAGGETTSFYLPNDLSEGATYYAKVQANSKDFPDSNYSAPVHKQAQTGSAISAENITFLSDQKNSIVGMREFLLTVTLDNFSNPASIYFIVSASNRPPAWGNVENNPARIARTFTSTKKKRKIYFSITDKYQRKLPAEITRVDLSAETQPSAENAKSKREAPGIMLPANTYYVHAYNNGKYVKTSAAITTLGYPTTPLPEQYNQTTTLPPSGRPPYSDYALQMVFGKGIPLEIGTQDIAYIPFRYLAIIDQHSQGSPALCPGQTDGIIVVQKSPQDPRIPIKGVYVTILSFQLGRITVVNDVDRASPSVFVASPQLPVTPQDNRNQVLDAMVKVKIRDFSYTLTTSCFGAIGPSALSGTPNYYLEYVDD